MILAGVVRVIISSSSWMRKAQRPAAGCAFLLLALLPNVCADDSSSSVILTTDSVVEQLLVANTRRAEGLRGYHGKRSYQVDYRGFPGSRHAEMQVEASYVAPDKKEFKIVSQSGSKLLINRVLLRLLESEKEALQEPMRQQTELSLRNYEFRFVETQHAPDGEFYVLEVKPRVNSKYLYRGQIWVDAHDFAVARIESEPAKNPSFWISRTRIRHQYAKVGEFWLPAHNESVTQVRLGGKAVLTIDYTDYEITGAPGRP